MTVAVKQGREGLRVLQLGYGAFGPIHARAWLAHGFAGRLTIADPSPQARVQAAQDLPGIAIVDDPHLAIAAADIVDIVTPADRHAADIALALEAACDVLVEKPLTLNTDEARQIASRVARGDRLLQVGWLMRWHPLAVALRDAVRSTGESVRWIDADFISLKRPRRDAGVLLNDAVHFIDMACWLLGTAPDEVTAVLRHPLGRTHEDIALVTLAFASGAVARIEASCVLAGELPDPVVPGGWSRKTMVVHTGTRRFEADFMRGVLQTAEAALEQRDGTWRPRFVAAAPLSFGEISWDDVMAAQVAGFVDAVTMRRQPVADVVSGLVACSICEAARRSALEKRTVRGKF